VFNIFNSNVLIEIGEAIGNIGRRLKRRSNPELVEQSFRKRLAEITVDLPDTSGLFVEPEGEVIDAQYTVVDDEEERK